MNNFFAYPRMLRSEALQKIKYLASNSIDQLSISSNEIDLSKYHYSPVIGKKIPEEKLNNIKVKILDIVSKINYPNKPSQQNLQEFDIFLTEYLHEKLEISANEASKNEVWNFFSIELLPGVVKWRFFYDSYEPSKDALVDRYLGGRRNTFQRLWWRGYTFKNLLKDQDPYSFLKQLNSDDMRELEERTTLFGNLSLVRSIAYNFIELKNEQTLQNTLPRDILRDVIRRLLRQSPWLSFESLTSSEINNHVADIYNTSLNNFNEKIKTIKSSITIQLKPDLPAKEIGPSVVEEKKRIVSYVSKKFQTEFEVNNPNFVNLLSKDNRYRVSIFISKRYARTNQKYWYTLNSKHENFLKQSKNSYIILGVEDKKYCFIIPYNWFEERKEYFNRQLTIQGSRTHLYIEDETGENYIVRSKDEEIPLESIESFIYPEKEKKDNKNHEPIHERQLIDPALELIKKYGNKGISTSELINELRLVLKPSGEDTKKLKGRSDDKFSQKVRNLKSHKKLDSLPNISFLNDKYYWIQNTSINSDKISIPKSIEWRSEHFIQILKDKLPLSGGEKAENQWNILKSFNNKSVLDFQDEASKKSYLNDYKYSFSPERDGQPWWDQELLYCIKRRIIKITDEMGNDVNLN